MRTSKSVQIGVLEYTITLDNIRIEDGYGSQGFDARELQVSVNVALRPERARANRPAAAAD